MTRHPPKKHDPVVTDDDLQAKVEAVAKDDAATSAEQQTILDLTEKLQKATEMAARSQAELQNAKIRMEKESQDIRKFAAESVLLTFLPTIDNLQRALKSLPKDLEKNSWVQGIVALEQEFLKQVGAMGLKRFESLGQKIDADRHEVLMQAQGEDGTVIDVLEDGYELHGKVVRPAKVKAGGG